MPPDQLYYGVEFGRLADDLSGAIIDACEAVPEFRDFATAAYNGAAGDGAVLPYVVFRISGGSSIRDSDVSRWADYGISFECLAVRADAANALATLLHDALVGEDGISGINIAWRKGVTSPLLATSRSQASERSRAPGSSRVYRSTFKVSARARIGPPPEES